MIAAGIALDAEGVPAMSDDNRIYFARRAQEEEERALQAADTEAQAIHRQLQRAYLEKALVGDRPGEASEPIG
jgi:hypothetical protein